MALIGIPILILIIIGAVLGGVLGTQLNKNKSSSSSSGTGFREVAERQGAVRSEATVVVVTLSTLVCRHWDR